MLIVAERKRLDSGRFSHRCMEGDLSSCNLGTSRHPARTPRPFLKRNRSRCPLTGHRGRDMQTLPAPHRTPRVNHPALPGPGAAGAKPPRPGRCPGPPWSSAAPWCPAMAARPGPAPAAPADTPLGRSGWVGFISRRKPP